MKLSAYLIAFSALLVAGHAQADALVGKVVNLPQHSIERLHLKCEGASRFDGYREHNFLEF
nr:hypothetical protein [uncultured Roseateles sp.]